jgi:pimeloyl-ACP methyl ester carboxylesterase
VLLAPAVAVSGWRSRLWPSSFFSTLPIPPAVASRCVVVVGTHDRVVPPAAVRALCASNPGMELVEVPGGDHTLNRAVIDSGRLRELVLRAHERGGGRSREAEGQTEEEGRDANRVRTPRTE